MIVYRIEDVDGVGFYHSNRRPHDHEDYHSRYYHPLPDEDELLKTAFQYHENADTLSEWNFGFESIEQLRSWLYADSWLIELSENFFLVEYDVPSSSVFCGTSQVMFMKRCYFEKFNIKEYFGLTSVVDAV